MDVTIKEKMGLFNIQTFNNLQNQEINEPYVFKHQGLYFTEIFVGLSYTLYRQTDTVKFKIIFLT